MIGVLAVAGVALAVLMPSALPAWRPVTVAAAEARSDGAGMRAGTSDAGRFKVSMSSRLRPLAINRMHAWVVAVAAPDGSPVTDAKIAVTGGIEGRRHGLPTAPRVTRHLGGGRYLLEGVKFTSTGHWRLLLEIESAIGRDSIAFDIVLEKLFL